MVFTTAKLVEYATRLEVCSRFVYNMDGLISRGSTDGARWPKFTLRIARHMLVWDTCFRGHGKHDQVLQPSRVLTVDTLQRVTRTVCFAQFVLCVMANIIVCF